MKIYSPNKEYSGISASVTFVNGTGETDNPHLIKWFKQHGYKVEETESLGETVPPENINSPDEEQDFSEMDTDMLKAYAEENGIDIGNATSKEGIVKKIKAASKE